MARLLVGLGDPEGLCGVSPAGVAGIVHVSCHFVSLQPLPFAASGCHFSSSSTAGSSLAPTGCLQLHVPLPHVPAVSPAPGHPAQEGEPCLPPAAPGALETFCSPSSRQGPHRVHQWPVNDSDSFINVTLQENREIWTFLGTAVANL